MPDNQEFSYDRDISPYASRYFDTIGNDPRLSHERKMQLQGSLLGGIEDIQAQRAKMQKEKDEGVLRSLNMREAHSDLEDARARRIQMQKNTEAVGGAKTQVNSILGDQSMSPEQKRQFLAQEELNHPLAGDPTLGKVFDLGREALPKEREKVFTPGQTVGYLSKLAGKVTPEELSLAMQDPVAMSVMVAEAEAMEKEDEEADKLQGRKDADALEIKKSMIRTRFKFGKDEDNMPTGKLDEESERNAELTVRALAPDKLKDFAALKQSGDHQALVQFVESVQDTHFDDMLGGKTSGKTSGPKSTGAVTDRSAARNAIFKKKE
jgi:hypothetical protein